MKQLHDGTEVPLDTPTKMRNGRRYLLTDAELAARQADVAAAEAVRTAPATRKAEVKAEAARRIEEAAPAWKQRRALSVWARMQDASAAGALNPAQQARLDGARALWDAVDNIRQISDALEAAIDDMDQAALSAFDAADPSHWA